MNLKEKQTAPADRPSALGGLRVLELSRVLAGPWAAQTLADLGADVIKVEHPGRGDDTRAWGPPHFEDPDDETRREAAYYLCANRNKRSVAIDFSRPEGAALVVDLARGVDILIENFRPGGLKKYGLDYDALCRINPRLVYCSITAYGQTGPDKHKPGYDFAIQAAGGLMSITGQPDGAPGGEPMKAGVAIADLFTGVYAAVGILAAVHARGVTGAGQHIDMSLFDTQVAMLANHASNYLVSGVVPSRLGNAHPNVVPYQALATADGHLVLAVGNDDQFRRCCERIGRPDLAEDARYRTNSSRIEHRDSLIAALAETFATRPTREWLDAMDAADIPCTPINRIDQVFAEPQADARGLRIEMTHPFGRVPLVASPIRLSETPASYRRPPPLLGEHTEEILTKVLGRKNSCFEQLRAAGIVR